jgi:hypothetical protein
MMNKQLYIRLPFILTLMLLISLGFNGNGVFNIALASRGSGANAPQLIIETLL